MIVQSSATLVAISSAFLVFRITMYIKERGEKFYTFLNLSTNFILASWFKPAEDDKNDISELLRQKKAISKYDAIRDGLILYEIPFPLQIIPGAIGICWLFIFGLYKPINMLTEFTLFPSDVVSIKKYFFAGLVILVVYVIWEICYITNLHLKAKKEQKEDARKIEEKRKKIDEEIKKLQKYSNAFEYVKRSNKNK